MLEFRKFEQKDEELLVSYLNDETLMQFLSARIPQPYTKESADWWQGIASEALKKFTQLFIWSADLIQFDNSQ